MMMKLLLLLIVLLLVVLTSDGSDRPSDVSIVAERFGADGTDQHASVVDLGGQGVRFMKYGRCILGAMFLEDEFVDMSPFSAFVVMSRGVGRVLERMQRDAPSLLQLGLGVGTVAQYLKRHGKVEVVHAVENSTTVIEFARKHFMFDAGYVFHAEAYQFLFDEGVCLDGEQPPLERYDVVVQDLYIGFNPTHVLNRQVFQRVHDRWVRPGGVYVVNFVGFHTGEHQSFTHDLVFTLRLVFKQVVCVRDMPPHFNSDHATNIICFASDDSSIVNFGEVDETLRNTPVEELYTEWIQDNFHHWRILSPNEMKGSELLQGQNLERYRHSFDVAASEMWDVVQQLLPATEWEKGGK